MSRQDHLSLQRVHNEPAFAESCIQNMLDTHTIALLERTPISQIRDDVDSCAEKLRSHLVPIAVSVAPDLPPDLREDVVQETLIAAICGDVAFDPERGTPDKYLRILMHTAANKVRRSYALPGNKALRTYIPAISLDIKQKIDGEEAPNLGETLPSGIQFEQAVIDVESARHLIDAADQTAPDEVAKILRLVYEEGHSVTTASSEIGVNRISARRHIDTWAKTELSEGAATLVA